jgi:hypothetical protein
MSLEDGFLFEGAAASRVEISPPLSNRRCGLGLWELSTFKWSKEITVH